MKLYPWWAVVWATLPAAAMKLAQELDDSALNLQTDSVSSGLLARASTAVDSDEGMNTSRDGSLDVVAAKKNPFKFVESIANTVKDAGTVVADAGLEMGKAAANRAVVIGNSVLESPLESLAEVGDVLSLPPDVVGPALEVGNVFDAVQDVGQFVVDATMDFGSGIVDQVRQSLQDAASRGLALVDQVGGVLQPFVGPALDAVGPLAAGLVGDAWNRLRGFLDCLQDTAGGGRRSLCEMLIGDQCDCSGGSYVRPSTGGVQMKCIFKASSVFARGYGIRATGSVDSSGETTLDANVLPGEDFEQAHRMHNQALRLRETVRQNQRTMRNMQRDLARGRQGSLSDYRARQPAGSCEGSLSVAVDGVIQWSPEVEFGATAETTTFTVRGMVRASMDALVTAEGSCSYKASKGFPKKPKTKIICAKGFCIVLAVQMVATLEVSGTLTGTVETSHDADFQVLATGTVTRDRVGNARDVRVEVSSPQLQHQEGWAVGVSASASVKLSAGPQLVVWPMAGIPITFHPAIHAEAKAIGTVFYPQEPQCPGSLIAQSANTSSNMTSNRLELQDVAKATPELPMCGAAAMTIYSDFGVTGFNLPPPLREILDSDFLSKALEKAMAEGAKAMMRVMTGPAQCAPGASQMTDIVNGAADVAAGKLKGLISALGLPWQIPLVQLLNPQRLFCAVVKTIPADETEFNSRPCAQDLGCKTAGQAPPPPSEEAATMPPENVRQTPRATAAAPTCRNLPMGDGFIELGAFRIGVTGHGHHGHERLVIAHKNGLVPVFWTEHGHVEHGPHKWDHGLWTRRPVLGGAANIKFGFQFIQIGDFRIGAVDDHHFSIAHRRTMMTAVIYTADGVTHPGHNHRRDWNVLDRPEGPPGGLTFGDRFVQFGKFRMGDTDGHHFYLMSPRKHFISLFLGDGGVNFYRPGVARWDLYLQQKMLRERLADWTCPDLAELAHGACTASWGGWGDRFLQLGNWRLGALDTGHFGICHRNGMNAHMYRHDGTVFLARQDPQLWRRPLGFPYGITFGKDFIQIGSFRIMAGDKDHLSISHPEFIGVNFRGWDSTVWLGKETHDKAASEKWSGWWGHHANKDSAGSAGPTRVMYGDRVLQIGNFRIGQMDSGDDLLLTHVDGHLKRTVSRFTSSGQVHAGNQDYHRWTSHIIYRPLQYHCSSLEDVMELCPGITAGDRFIQIGDFRISQSMPGALSISHRSGLVSKVFFSDGRLQTNLGGDASRPHNAWWKEARELHHADAGSLKFGDRFIQIGDFRLGADEGQGYDSVILTHRHFDVIQFWNHNGGLVPGANVGARHHHRGRDIWARPVGPPRGVSFGDRFVQIGNYRFGAFDGHHFTVAHKDGVIAELFTGYDGLQHNGPIAKWTTFGRPMRQCKVMPPRHRVP